MHDVGRRMRAGQKPREKLDQATEQWRCPICFWRRWRPGIAPREIISNEASAARDRLARSESTFLRVCRCRARPFDYTARWSPRDRRDPAGETESLDRLAGYLARA